MIVSPFVTKRRTLQMVDSLQVAVRKNVTVTIVTRPVEDFETKNRNVLIEALKLLVGIGIHLVYKTPIHQKCCMLSALLKRFYHMHCIRKLLPMKNCQSQLLMK